MLQSSTLFIDVIQCLTHLLSAIITARCVPSAWRQGVVVHLPKGGDTGDCSNCRPLTLLPVVDDLFAKLLLERIARAMCLHDQQYTLLPGRGTLNPLQNVLAVVREFTQAIKSSPRLTSPEVCLPFLCRKSI